MAKKSIVWSARANTELKKVLEFYTKRNGNNEYSSQLLVSLDKRIALLGDNGMMGRLTDDKKARVLFFSVYSIFYDIHDTQIEILSFWDNRQNPTNSLVRK